MSLTARRILKVFILLAFFLMLLLLLPRTAGQPIGPGNKKIGSEQKIEKIEKKELNTEAPKTPTKKEKKKRPTLKNPSRVLLIFLNIGESRNLPKAP